MDRERMHNQEESKPAQPKGLSLVCRAGCDAHLSDGWRLAAAFLISPAARGRHRATTYAGAGAGAEAAGGGDGDLSPEEQLEGIRDYYFIFYMGRVHMSMTYLILFVTYTP
jgi:hypothetical protein